MGIFIALVLVMSVVPITVKQLVHALPVPILTLDPIANVVQGQDITVTGSLTDSETGNGIEGATITFDGTGAANLGPAVTDGDGRFAVTGASPNMALAGWNVQAHFSGDENYESVDSNTQTYDTTGFTVNVGTEVNVELTGFDASITFDEVVTEGEMAVTDCNSSSSPRYAPLDTDRCLDLSSTAELAPGTFAHVSMSFDEATIPHGYTANDVSIFHDDGSSIVDITKSRDVTNNVVVGRTNDFSKFIVAVALHGEKPVNSVRQKIFTGDGNIVTIRDISNLEGNIATIAFSKDKVPINRSLTVTVNDPEANLDPDTKNTVRVLLTSTSDSEGLIIELTETANNTGVFKGSVKLTKTPGSADSLFVKVGDNIEAKYQVTNARLQAIIDGMSEAGEVELSDFLVDADEVGATFTRLGNGIDMKLIDAQLDDEGKITVTMSYANFDIEGQTESDLKLFKREDLGDGVINWIDITTSVDVDTKTVTGETDSIGEFAIGCCPDNGPGGAGGGPSLPGAGIVLDDIATVGKASGGGGGGSSSRPSNTTPEQTPSNNSAKTIVSSGPNVEAKILIDRSEDDNDVTISLTFESVASEGNLTVTEKPASDFHDILLQIDQNKIIAKDVESVEYSVIGSVFDIDASDITFAGIVDVTIPYNETSASEQGNESWVRFLHYTGTGWEDSTINIDIASNTVTGRVSSLSPVMAAVIDDGTFGVKYSDEHPTSRIIITDKSPTIEGHTGDHLSISAQIKNMQRVNQNYVFVIQIIDSDGVTQNLSWQTGMLVRSQSTEISSSWLPQQAGIYQIQIFVFADMDNPLVLSEKFAKNLTII
jgi:hypothetical protein